LGVKIDTRQNTFSMLSKDEIIELIVVQERQAIKCSSVVLGCSQNDFEQAIVISIPRIILGINRRKFERLPIVMDLEYSLLPLGTEYKNLKGIDSKYFRSFRKTYTVNISAGGVCFISSKNELDSKLAVVSFLVKKEKITTLCEKIRTDTSGDPKHDRVAYKYNEITTQHRQLILDFVTEKSKENSNY
jgi:c-di-GMP-binding flagellar brake protein YcgR